MKQKIENTIHPKYYGILRHAIKKIRNCLLIKNNKLIDDNNDISFDINDKTKNKEDDLEL